MSKSATFWINHLNLQKHPEGGYFNEYYRSEEIINARNVATAIYYLLKNKNYSAFHRIDSDEIWHFYDGSPIIIYTLMENGELKEQILGNETPSLVIPKNHWFAAELLDKDSYGLVGCTVSPGFEYSKFELAKKEELIKEFPKHKELIVRLT